jgi:hypothetical protein
MVQEGSQIKPDELRGILIRIRNVGIGYYDPSLLDYPVNHGPRSRWVTGEIFIDQGLENTLNVDRDSFNLFDPEYRTLQRVIHLTLKDIFSEIYVNIDKRSTAKRLQRERQRDDALQKTVDDADDRSIVIAENQRLGSFHEPFSESQQTRRSVAIEIAPIARVQTRTKKTSAQLARSLLAIFELATLEGSREEQRTKFTKLLFDLLKKW